MLTDKTHSYENKAYDHSYIEEHQQQFEKTSQFSNIDDNSTNYNDQETNEQSVIFSKDPEVQKSICLQENEIQRLSQAYADKYYYEMKFEQYQNLLAQQQCSISKLLNDKKELQEKLEKIIMKHSYQENLDSIQQTHQLEQKLEELQLQNENLTQQNELYNNQLDETKRLLQKLNREQESLQQQFQEYKLQVLIKEQEQQSLIAQLQSKSFQESKLSIYQELQLQMNEIKEQNNYLFDQLSKKEKEIEQNFQKQLSNLAEQFAKEKQELQEEFEQQQENKDEIIHHLEIQVNDLQNQAQQLYSENLQLQNQLDLLAQNYSEDFQQQANALSEQVAEYKIIINNLENQIFVMNAEIQRRGRSNGKENGQRVLQGLQKINQQRLSTGEMTFSNITPNSKSFQYQNLKN
ncbi:unnamed protein product (macronuclear) [Paramecium tetraurelia]|uniref:Uncharacterized protein n=1 Tax=Paramecium tetraurelia TaxID=5888 RepID=A0DW97_PARTE|nr:uncharacterized protein GSPATT00020956001 [Paramecium tetraurelia]CAK87314.1 unnamed protein product [Paramecium tetraurelia]|eukprot:XP_001454711.1 hypothetical protein (macronuclear) [Paramecium tetraurelia strain d4-2]